MTTPQHSHPDQATVAEYKGLPIVGLLPEFLLNPPLTVLQDAVKQYGGFVKLNLGPTSAYLVSDPDLFQQILRDNHRNYPKPDLFYGALKKVAGNGLVTSEGDFWLRQRRMIQPFMYRKYLAGLIDIMAQGIAEALETWDDLATRGESIDISAHMTRITINVVTKSMFGQDLSLADMDTVSRLVPAILDYLSTRGFLPFIPDWVPLPGDQKFAASHAELRLFLMRLINQRRHATASSTDLITMLLNSVDDETNEQMTDDQLFDEALTIFAAGFETTSNTLTWLWYILSQHPDVEQALRTEIRAVVGLRTPTMEDIRSLSYTKMVISETLRLFPAAPLLPRTAIEDDWFGNYHIPAGATVLLFYYGLHHNPSVWDNPDLFDPERFSPEASQGRSQFAWVPFSAGPRKCIGDEFAMMEAILSVVMILQHFDVHITAEDVHPRINATLRPSKPITATLRRVSQ